MTNGKTKNKQTEGIFEKQKQIQNYLLENNKYGKLSGNCKELPADCTTLFAHHILWLYSELGEILQADKRWKSSRNDKYNKEEKLEELADCLIIFMNVCLFSGFDSEDILEAVIKKQDKVMERLSK